MKSSGRFRRLTPSLCLLICIAVIGMTQEAKALSPGNASVLNPPELFTPMVNGLFVTISWNCTTQTAVVNHTIRICHPCNNCINVTLVNLVNQSHACRNITDSRKYKHRLPVNNTCYLIQIRTCNGFTCGNLSKSVTVNPTRIATTLQTETTSWTELVATSSTELVATSSTANPTMSDLRKGGDSNVGLIVGVTLGCVAALVVAGGIVTLIVHQRRKRSTKDRSEGPRALGEGTAEAYDAQDDRDRQTVTTPRQIGLWNMGCELPPSARKEVNTSRKSKRAGNGTVLHKDIALESQDVNPSTDMGENTGSNIRKPMGLQKNASLRPGIAKEVITVDGGTLQTEDVTLRIGPGCLSKDTEITMIMDDHNFAFKSLLDLGLLQVEPRVIEFLPDGLEFVKAADLTIHLKDIVSSELFVLHGSYDSKRERTIWTVVTDETDVNANEGYVNMKINGFCFYSYIRSTRGKLARILSHLNNSFSCYAVGLYRRIPTFPNIDVAVVFLSEFVQMHEDKRNASQLNMMIRENKYHKSETGSLKRVDTHRRLEMRLEFPELDPVEPLVFKVDVPQLDSVGMVLDNFREISQGFPARGKVLIYEVYRSNRRLLWTLNITEEQAIESTSVEVPSSQPDETDQNKVSVVMRTTKLSAAEISRLSLDMGVDWDSLAGLLDISYVEREELRLNVQKYPNFSSKAEVILTKFNKSKFFNRELLVKYLEELGRHDLRKNISTGVPQAEDPQEKSTQEDEDGPDNNNESDIVKRDTPLSSREMYRLSRLIVDWDSLAGLMDIPLTTKEGIRNSAVYPDTKSRAEKVLSLFNNSKAFCREKLAGYLQEIGHHDLTTTVTKGSYRCL